MIIGKRSSVIRYIVLLVLVATSTLLWPDASVKAQNNSPAATTSPNEFLNTLSQQEREWLRAHPVIRVFQDPDWPPIAFSDESGKPIGMMKDYLNLIEQRLGQRFEPVLNLSWHESLAGMKRGEIDMTTSAAETPERLEFLAFTKPYMNIPIVIATQQGVTYIGNLNELKGRKVAAIEGSALHEWMQNDFPEVRLLKVKSTLDGLQRLQRGELDAYIDNLVTIGHHQSRHDVLTVKVAGATPYFNSQRMAVRKDWAPFAGILQKALDSITETERDAIFRKWLPLQYQSTFDYTRLWPIAAVLFVGLIGLGAWIVTLTTEKRRRERAEVALQEKERLLLESQRIAHIGGWSWAFTGPIQWTDETYRIYGVSPETFIPTFEALGNLVHPEDRPIMQEWTRACGAGEKPAEFEFRSVWPDGTVRFLSGCGERINDAENRTTHIIGTVQDITERKQAQIASEVAISRLQATLDALPDLLFEVGAEGRIFSYHTHRSDLLAAPPEVFMGKQFADVLPPEAASACQRAIDEAAQNGSSYGETIRLALAQGERWFELSVAPMHTAAKSDQRFIMISRDITERKLAAEALQETQAMLARTEEIGKIGGWEFDIATRQQTWTREIYAIHEVDFTGYPTVEQGISFYTPESQPIIEQAVQRAIEHGEPFDLELEIITAKGNLRAVHTIGRHDPVRGKIVGFFQDITERKHAARLLAESESQRRAEMSAALEVQNQSSRAALSLMEDALAARQRAESLGVTLTEQLDELRRWQQVTLNRESRILSAKKEINDLLAEHGQPPRYPSAADKGVEE